ncbi:lipocalin family protein [Alistipes sp.]|uniref:lipocalin family protein n=1 Tax=Alistipes sp. TaxID=1872444 RepID=UPI003AF036BF
MKNIRITLAALAVMGLAASCSNEPKTFTGTIADASMNTVTVKESVGDRTVTFSTMNADKAAAYGLLLGAPITVDYKGRLKEGIAATRVATDPTYSAAVGRWTMADPNDPEAVMGIEIEVEGQAQSINMATLLYNAWKLTGEPNRIELFGQSLGNGQTIDFTQTGLISKGADDSYSLTIEGTDAVYTKANE